MKLDKITRKLTEAITNSIQLAQEENNSEQVEEHIIYNILNDDSGMAEILLSHLKLDRFKFRNLARQSILKLSKVKVMHVEPSRGFMAMLKKSRFF